MILQNNSNKMQVYTLDHASACKDSCSCTASEHPQTVHDRKTGLKSLRMVPVMVPASLYISARASVQVSDAASNVAQIKNDLKLGILLVKKGS